MVETGDVLIKGKQADGVDVFYNIPYAFPGRFERSEFDPDKYMAYLVENKTDVVDEVNWLYANDNVDVACYQGWQVGTDRISKYCSLIG